MWPLCAAKVTPIVVWPTLQSQICVINFKWDYNKNMNRPSMWCRCLRPPKFVVVSNAGKERYDVKKQIGNKLGHTLSSSICVNPDWRTSNNKELRKMWAQQRKGRVRGVWLMLMLNNFKKKQPSHTAFERKILLPTCFTFFCIPKIGCSSCVGITSVIIYLFIFFPVFRAFRQIAICVSIGDIF